MNEVLDLVRDDTHALENADAFFSKVRSVAGSLSQPEVNIVNLVLKEASAHPMSWVAYELATAWHEARFIPQNEWGLGKGHPYGSPGKYGQAQYGRGLVQLTWDRNYEWADASAASAGLITKGELLHNFNLALRPDIAVFILVRGMETGAFTGRRLSQCLPQDIANRQQFVDSRTIINGHDKAEAIADYALSFQEGLKEGGW
jgi:hypothetical protein